MNSEADAAPGPPGYAFSYTLSPVDHFLACLLLYRHRRFVLHTLLFFVIVSAAILAITGIRLGYDRLLSTFADNWELLAGILVLAALMPVLRGLISMLASLFTAAARRQVDLHVSADGIRAVTPIAEVTYKWSAFKSRTEFAGRAFATLASGASIVMPRRGLVVAEDWSSLNALLRERITG